MKKLTPQFLNHGPKDWPEDFSHENGNYLCRCTICESEFTGHKRRVTCKECSVPTTDAGNIAGTPLTDAETAPNDPTGKPGACVDADFARDLERQLHKAVNFCICAYCKKKLPKSAESIMLHMQECEKHPLGDALRAEVALKEQLAKCESEWSEMAKEADRQVASLQADLAKSREATAQAERERDEAISALDDILNESAVISSSAQVEKGDFVDLQIQAEHYESGFKILEKTKHIIE